MQGIRTHNDNWQWMVWKDSVNHVLCYINCESNWTMLHQHQDARKPGQYCHFTAGHNENQNRDDRTLIHPPVDIIWGHHIRLGGGEWAVIIEASNNETHRIGGLGREGLLVYPSRTFGIQPDQWIEPFPTNSASSLPAVMTVDWPRLSS
jgi:hypothetical protein